jgi:hypothetical protein
VPDKGITSFFLQTSPVWKISHSLLLNRLHLSHKKDSFRYYFPGQNMKSFLRHNSELLIWSFALLYLVIIDPSHRAELSICPIHQMGFSWCPGCGLGRSLSFLLHGSIAASFETHWLGIPASIIIVYRSITLLVNEINRISADRTLNKKRRHYAERHAAFTDA